MAARLGATEMPTSTRPAPAFQADLADRPTVIKADVQPIVGEPSVAASVDGAGRSRRVGSGRTGHRFVRPVEQERGVVRRRRPDA